MNPGAPPYRCIPGRPTTCNHATQAAVVARPHPSRAVRLRPTRLPPPGPPPRHRTTPRSPKGHVLDKIHEPNHLRTASDHSLKGNRAQMAGGRGRRRRSPQGRMPRSATARCRGGGRTEPPSCIHERPPGRPSRAERRRPAAGARLDKGRPPPPLPRRPSTRDPRREGPPATRSPATRSARRGAGALLRSSRRRHHPPVCTTTMPPVARRHAAVAGLLQSAAAPLRPARAQHPHRRDPARAAPPRARRRDGPAAADALQWPSLVQTIVDDAAAERLG